MTKAAYTFRYRVRNWSHYNRALIARGELTFWIDESSGGYLAELFPDISVGEAPEAEG